MAKLADPTNPDPDHAMLMHALAVGARDEREPSGPAPAQPKLTGYESTAERRVSGQVSERLPLVATQPSPVAPVAAVRGGAAARAEAVSEPPIEPGVDRSAMTAAPATPGGAGAGPGSIQYLSQPRPRPDGARPAAKIQHTAPLVGRRAVQQHFTVPMAGRPSREAATPEPQELAARPTSKPARASSRSTLGRLRRLVEPRALPLAVAVAAGIVALVLFVAGKRGTGERTSSPARPAPRAWPLLLRLSSRPPRSTYPGRRRLRRRRRFRPLFPHPRAGSRMMPVLRAPARPRPHRHPPRRRSR